MIISLCGFMGCGKSRVGTSLSKLLNYRLIDLDNYIEEKYQMTISEIFKDKGQEGFRLMESIALEEILENTLDENIILSLGGGSLNKEENRSLIKEKSHCFYLSANKNTLIRNLRNNQDKRPLLQGQDLEEAIDKLLEERISIYEESGEYTIIVDGKHFEKVAIEMYNLILFGQK